MTARSMIGLGLVLAVACSSSNSTTASNASGGGAGSGGVSEAGGLDATGGSGGITFGCPSGCSASDFCSASGTCIPKGTCANNADCHDGMTCNASNQCVVDGGCGNDVIQVAAVPPNMMIVLDRSCSMKNKLANGQTKWESAVGALNGLITNFLGQIRWGLILFPSRTEGAAGSNCKLKDADVNVAIGAHTAGPIQTLLTASLTTSDPNYPSGPCVTNIDSGIHLASVQPQLKQTTRQSFVLLITDGKQSNSCHQFRGDAGTADDATTQMITNMQAAGIDTFVVGFGSGVDASQMNTWANAGGVPRNDPTTQYYQADDATTLQSELGTIAGSVVSCTFSLASTPPDPNLLYVFFGQSSVQRDPTHQSGWDYDSATNQITFYGSSCSELKSQRPKVNVVYGCDQAPN
jgi:hypothetical protein